MFSAPDFPFKGWQPAQMDGYGQSAASPGENAIVIDAGMELSVEQRRGQS